MEPPEDAADAQSRLHWVRVWENQRKALFGGYSADALVGRAERGQWSNAEGHASPSPTQLSARHAEGPGAAASGAWRWAVAPRGAWYRRPGSNRHIVTNTGF